MADTYYRALLAQPAESNAGILQLSTNYTLAPPRQSRHPRTLGQQDRSSSAPNVCLHLVKQNGEENPPRSLSLNRSDITGYQGMYMKDLLKTDKELEFYQPFFNSKIFYQVIHLHIHTVLKHHQQVLYDPADNELVQLTKVSLYSRRERASRTGRYLQMRS